MIDIEKYSSISDEEILNKIADLASKLKDAEIVHVNSTRLGGGVAEILNKLIPLMNNLGIKTSWEVIEGENDFYVCTKGFHNGIQGNEVNIDKNLLNIYEQTNEENSRRLQDVLEKADFVIIHDPQPAALINHFPNRKGKWVWRCHIDASNPDQDIWNYLSKHISYYDGSIFSIEEFVQEFTHDQYLIPPSIDPLSEKNIVLKNVFIGDTYSRFNIDNTKPVISQVSRFDIFKDPIGVINAYRIVKNSFPELQLILAGGDAADDPEGAEVLKMVRSEAGDDKDIKLILLPPDANLVINSIQRLSDIILQKSLKEGFGLTVAEGLWKEKPVIGGNTGGIKIQIRDNENGFLVNSIDETAEKIEYLLENPQLSKQFGKRGKEHVRKNFLITRHLLQYLELIDDQLN